MTEYEVRRSGWNGYADLIQKHRDGVAIDTLVIHRTDLPEVINKLASVYWGEPVRMIPFYEDDELPTDEAER